MEQAIEQPRVRVKMRACPVCSRPSILARSVAESQDVTDAGLWHYCSCGVMFQDEAPNQEIKGQDYINNHYVLKEYKDVAIELARTYAPIIELATYGRKMLDVGFGTYENMEFFKKRGWVTYGMDTNKDIIETDRIFKDDFETTDKLYENHFDMVWMSHVLEKFKDPIKAIKMASTILQEGGVLFIATPDISFQYSSPLPEWQHWKRKENYLMWSEEALCKELEKQGFNILVKYRNYYKRFGYFHNMHIVCQRIFY